MIDLLRAAEAVERAYVESLPDPERDAQLYRINLLRERESALLSVARATSVMAEHDQRERREGKQELRYEDAQTIFLAVRECRGFLRRYQDDEAVTEALSRIQSWMTD